MELRLRSARPGLAQFAHVAYSRWQQPERLANSEALVPTIGHSHQSAHLDRIRGLSGELLGGLLMIACRPGSRYCHGSAVGRALF